MIEWHKTMQQTFEYYIVDPLTWRDKQQIKNVVNSTIDWDSETETLGSLSISIGEPLEECYVRIYIIIIQNEKRYKRPLGTFMVQTPTTNFDGKVRTVSLDAYSPIIELKEKQPPIGYSILEGDNIMDIAYRLIRENVRAPVYKVEDSKTLDVDFVANTDDNMVTFIRDLIANAKYSLMLDEMGNILFAPVQEVATLQPKFTFNDDNSSILHPTIELKHDLYGVPNVVEVVYSSGNNYYFSRVVNEDTNSPISTINRGREIIKRVINPSGLGNPSQEQVDMYAKTLLKNLSSIEYTVSFTHGYCDVRVGDCVRLNYNRAKISNVKAKIIRQSITCETGATVKATAVYTNKLWG